LPTTTRLALQYTEALNALLIQSSGPLFVALWALLLFGVRLTWAQLLGIVISLTGVLTILLRGDLTALAAIHFNKGDLLFASAVLAFGLYSAVMTRRPVTHPLSLITFTMAGGSIMLVPFAAWQIMSGFPPKADWLTAATFAYAVIFPSTLAYLCFNRGIALIGPNRAAPFLHLVPVFGSGARDHPARRGAEAVPRDRLRAGAGRRRDRLAAGLGEDVSIVP
jgi:drug/metabolite transporter (DMT)-like permease